MFVTSSDFNILNYQLASMSTGEAQEFQQFIDQQEEKYLKQVLGSNLYDAFTSGLPTYTYSATVATVIGRQYAYGNDVWEAVTVTTGTSPVAGSDWTLIEEDNRWLLLKNGNTYSISGKKYIWVGMVETLKALIFSKWIRYTYKKHTGNGFVVPKIENNYSVNPSQDICDAWNEWSKCVGGQFHPYNSLYGYIYYTNLDSGTFDDTFDETFDTFIDYLAFEFTPQETINIYGI